MYERSLILDYFILVVRKEVGPVLGTRRARTCKVFRLARKLSTAPADLDSRPRAPQRVGVRVRVRDRVRSGVGFVWTAQPSFCGDLHTGSRYT